MRTLDDVIGKLPAARRQKVEARAQELIAEELTLQDIRKARKLTQEQMATTLNIGQDSISRLEKRSDMIITSIRDVSPQPKAVSRRKKPKLVRG